MTTDRRDDFRHVSSILFDVIVSVSRTLSITNTSIETRRVAVWRRLCSLRTKVSDEITRHRPWSHNTPACCRRVRAIRNRWRFLTPSRNPFPDSCVKVVPSRKERRSARDLSDRSRDRLGKGLAFAILVVSGFRKYSCSGCRTCCTRACIKIENFRGGETKRSPRPIGGVVRTGDTAVSDPHNGYGINTRTGDIPCGRRLGLETFTIGRGAKNRSRTNSEHNWPRPTTNLNKLVRTFAVELN